MVLDRSTWTALVVGIGCFGLCAVGAGCIQNDQYCPVDLSLIVPMAVIGVATLIPVVGIFGAYFLDWRYAKNNGALGEGTSMIPPTATSLASYRIPVYMYSSHFLSSWGDRMWQFAIPLLFMEIFIDSLLPSALFSLVVYIVGVLTVPAVGAWIDHTNRLRVMQISILIENGCIIISTIALGSILLVIATEDNKIQWSWAMIGLFGATLISGAVGQVYSDAQTLSIQQDWVVVISRETNTPLSQWNTALRRIDLICKLASPSVFGIIMDFAGSDQMTRAATGAAVVGVWNLLAAPLEYAMRVDSYHFVPALHSVPSQKKSKPGVNYSEYLASWKDYYMHPTFLASFSFCALYMTVLTGSGLNLAYLQWRGVPQSIIGASSGLGALFGLFGTLIFPCLSSCLKSVERVAVWSVWLFWLTLLPVWIACMWYGETTTSDYIMMVCILISRLWLWSCDLAETQIMQEWVEADRRGSINAMQNATSKMFYIAVLLVGVFFSDPRQFIALVSVSIGAVLLAAIGFTVWYARYVKA